MATKLFRIKTTEGHSLKVMSELLHHNLKTAAFDLTKTKMSLRMMDENEFVLYDIVYNKTNFNVFTYNYSEPSKCIGVNLKHLHEMLKNVKKRDTVELSIDKDTPNDLCIEIIPKENTRSTISTIKIQPYQNIITPLPGYNEDTKEDEYPDGVIIQSVEFQKMCKESPRIDKKVNIN